MHCLRFNLLCKSLSITVTNRKFQTYSVLLARRKEKFSALGDQGLKHMKKVFENDEEFQERLSDENDIAEFGDVDLGEINESYGRSMREKESDREFLARQITKKKFFVPEKQPQMLTVFEKQCMKFLHKKDPKQWNVQALSESFPATPLIVNKVLRANYKITPEKEKKINLSVQKNWKLLAENKLDGDPEFLEHCKKFVNNRDIIFDHINNQNFNLPQISKKKEYNNGEMYSILADYEKAIDELLCVDKYLPNDDKDTKNDKLIENKSSLELLREKINEETECIDLEGKESFKLKLSSQTSREQVTFDEIQETILKKAEEKNNLNIVEKAILEVRLRKINEEGFKSDFTRNVNENKISNKNKSKNLKTSKNDFDFPQTRFNEKVLQNENTLNEEEEFENNFMNKNIIRAENLGKVLQFTENSVTFQNESNEEIVKPKKIKNKKLETDESVLAPNNCLNENKTNNDFINKDYDVLKVENSPLKGDNTFNIESNQSFESAEELKEAENKVKCSSEVLKHEEACENEGLYDANRQIERKVFESQNTTPKIYSNISNLSNYKDQKSVEFEDYYPERIIIPKEKRNLGSLFKVRDCYYDSNGRFLYRVPGITK